MGHFQKKKNLRDFFMVENQEKINVVTLWTVDSKSVVQAKGLGTDVVADR